MKQNERAGISGCATRRSRPDNKDGVEVCCENKALLATAAMVACLRVWAPTLTWLKRRNDRETLRADKCLLSVGGWVGMIKANGVDAEGKEEEKGRREEWLREKQEG